MCIYKRLFHRAVTLVEPRDTNFVGRCAVTRSKFDNLQSLHPQKLFLPPLGPPFAHWQIDFPHHQLNQWPRLNDRRLRISEFDIKRSHCFLKIVVSTRNTSVLKYEKTSSIKKKQHHENQGYSTNFFFASRRLADAENSLSLLKLLLLLLIPFPAATKLGFRRRESICSGALHSLLQGDSESRRSYIRVWNSALLQFPDVIGFCSEAAVPSRDFHVGVRDLRLILLRNKRLVKVHWK